MAESKERPIRREHDSMDDFEHLEHEQDGLGNQFTGHMEKVMERLKDDHGAEGDMINFSSDHTTEEHGDPKKATSLLLEYEKGRPVVESKFEVRPQDPEVNLFTDSIQSIPDQSEIMKPTQINQNELKKQETEKIDVNEQKLPSPLVEVTSAPEKKQEESWNIVEKSQPVPELVTKKEKNEDSVSECVVPEIAEKRRMSMPEVVTLEADSEMESSPSKTVISAKQQDTRRDRVEEVEIAPKEIFSSMGLDAWFNPDRLNPKVAALIYWRDPKKTGAVFGCILSVLLSLAYFSLISVLAYLSLLILAGTIAIRIHNTVLQAIQKTSDGHPFKKILEMDLTVPAQKVHEVADVAVAHLNAAVGELRRLFLVEDFVDSLKFGVILWCLTYVGSWFNGMTLVIIGVIALFTLPKVYETNKAQIDQNLALMRGKIKELSAKVKAAIPFGKKEPTKEE